MNLLVGEDEDLKRRLEQALDRENERVPTGKVIREALERDRTGEVRILVRRDAMGSLAGALSVLRLLGTDPEEVLREWVELEEEGGD